MRERIVDDGKSIVVVDEENKLFFRQQHVPTSIFALMRCESLFSDSGAATVAPTGSMAFRIYLFSTRAHGVRGQFRILKSNGELLTVRSVHKSGGRSGYFDVEYRNQKLDQPIPRNTFQWTAPKGYKLMPLHTLAP
jgi:outer membrane lipoprotein-sorting protein